MPFKRAFMGGGDASRASASARSLADDLSRLAETGAFDPRRLAEAPLIDSWTIDFRPSAIVRGLVTGHPKLADGPYATFELVAFDDGAGWARSFDGLYRLGRACHPGDR